MIKDVSVVGNNLIITIETGETIVQSLNSRHAVQTTCMQNDCDCMSPDVIAKLKYIQANVIPKEIVDNFFNNNNFSPAFH